ncbi:hypothetical protein HPP92_002949 [Vanilla planifolia]|uniref:Uncharacterized protein n=1 Tax=Vanilla planifolia TaxID=51239 RepID=A0A835S6G9_VANPL|nr:hypothetical protein HPP92_002949 [Vanilla planifolia]
MSEKETRAGIQIPEFTAEEVLFHSTVLRTGVGATNSIAVHYEEKESTAKLQCHVVAPPSPGLLDDPPSVPMRSLPSNV